MKGFEVLDISGDIGLRAYGEDIKDAFINAAVGMYSFITDLETVENKKTISIPVESDSIEGLLVSWLNELIFHFDAYGFIGKKITIIEITPSLTLPPPYTLKASISGEDFNPQRHESKLLIKAATYHKLRIEKIGDMWEIDVIFDI